MSSGEDFKVESIHEAFPPTIKDMVSDEKKVVLGKIDLENVPVFIHNIAFRLIADYFSTQPNLELEGALIGSHCKDEQEREFVEIVDFFPFVTSRATPVSTEASVQEWHRASKRICEIRNSGSDVQIVGWVHSHPGMKPAPSDTDTRTIEAHFFLPWQVALIIDPKKRKIGVFGFSKKEGVINKGGLIGYSEKSNDKLELSKYSYCPSQHF